MRPHHGRLSKFLIPLAVALAASGCVSGPGGRYPAPDRAFYGRTGQVAETVTRAETIEIAEAYLQHRWYAQKRNIRHGLDSAGVRVDTPDHNFNAPGIRPGWWRPGTWNTGVPYQWGGFSNLEDFDKGLRDGLAAGDVYTDEKRRQLQDAVSVEAVGIDCSGFISRCWKLPRPASTRRIPSLCEPLASYDELRPGDVLNLHNAHVLLFAGWADAEKTRLIAYEAGSPPTWKVLKNTIEADYVRGLGYQPFRYRGIRDE